MVTASGRWEADTTRTITGPKTANARRAEVGRESAQVMEA